MMGRMAVRVREQRQGDSEIKNKHLLSCVLQRLPNYLYISSVSQTEAREDCSSAFSFAPFLPHQLLLPWAKCERSKS